MNHIFICCTIFCNECLLSCASPQSTVLVQNLSFIFIAHYENEIFVSRHANYFEFEDERRRSDRLFVFAENLCMKGKY